MQSRLYDSMTILSHFIAMILIIVIFLITDYSFPNTRWR